jgi:aryl-alcohol dehydrogenase-like predicted oxidoreductase
MSPVTLQLQYSLLSREVEWEIVPAAQLNGTGLLPWSPLAGGFLAGKYQRGRRAPAGTRAGSEKPLYQWISEEYADSDRNWVTIDAVVRIAKEIGATPAQVALSWIADRPASSRPSSVRARSSNFAATSARRSWRWTTRQPPFLKR